MLLPMKAVTRHRGMAQTTAPLTQPTMDMIRPSNCMPVVAMVKGVVWIRWICLGFISVCVCCRRPTYSPTKKCDSLQCWKYCAPRHWNVSLWVLMLLSSAWVRRGQVVLKFTKWPISILFIVQTVLQNSQIQKKLQLLLLTTLSISLVKYEKINEAYIYHKYLETDWEAHV